MAVPALEALVEELDQDTHHARVSRLARLGRDERGTARLNGLLDELVGLGGYWHELALVAAVAAGQGARVVAGLTDPAANVRSFAWAHLIQAGVGVDEVIAAGSGASAIDRGRLIGVVCRSGRSDVAARLLERLRPLHGDREAARLLPACPAPMVVELLPTLDHAVPSWRSLARRHPGPVLDHLGALLEAAPRSQRDQLWRMVGPGAAVAAETSPERVLALLEASGPSGGPGRVLGRGLGRLVRAFPARTVSLLLRPEHRGPLARAGIPPAVARNARALPEADRLALARAVRENDAHVAGFLGRLPPRWREPLFRATYADVETGSTCWHETLLEALPHGTRAAEAARMLQLREVADDRGRSLAVTSFLPIVEARPRLEQALATAKAEDRAMAYRLLVDCTRRSRSSAELGITLRTLRRLRNEQDPVRLAATVALARTPPHLFDDGDLPELSDLITSVIEARDSSFTTIDRLRRLMVRFLALRPSASPALDLALAELDRLAEPSGTISLDGLRRDLPRGAEGRLVAALLPRLQRDADHERFDLALSLAAALGRQAWGLDDLQELLGRATRAPLDSTVRRAVDLWLAPPRSRADRVGQVVAADPSTLTLPRVLAAVTGRRQDLLDVLFRPPPAKGRFRLGRTDRPPLRGRFLSGDVRYVPVITSGVGRWLPRQHRAYADALHQLIADPATRTWAVAAALGALARLPQIGADELVRYSSSNDVPVFEAVLAGLAWTDNPAAHLIGLLALADGDRARVAVYAASRSARFARPDDLGPALATVLESPTSKVTARKEAVRLLAQQRPPQALDRLLKIGSDAGTPRDVRIAVGRAVRAFLDDERVWPVLAGLAEGGPDEARSLLDTGPADIATRHRSRFAAVVARVAAHPDPLARNHALALLAAWSPWSPEATDVAVRHVADLTSGPGWRYAAASLVAIYADENGTGQTDALLVSLATAATDPGDDAGLHRDRPARQRLGAIIDGLVSLPLDQRARLRPVLLRTIDRLPPDPSLLGWKIELLLSAADFARPTGTLLSINGLLVRRPVGAAAAAAALQAALEREQATWQPDDLAEALTALAGGAEVAAKLLALGIVAVAGPRSGWTEPWRSALRAIRSAADPDVVAAALRITTTRE